MCAKEPDDSNSKIIESFFTKKEFKIEKKYFIRVHFFITDKRKSFRECPYMFRFSLLRPTDRHFLL